MGTNIESLLGKCIDKSIEEHSAKRLLATEEQMLAELRNALLEGENSKMVENYDAKSHLAEIHRRYLR